MGRGRALGIAVLALAAACTTVEEGDGGVGTTGGGTTTGGTMGPPDNTVCLNSGPGNGGTAIADELSPCSLNRDCICPLECLADSQRLAILGPSGKQTRFCERSCATSADCPLESEVCVPSGDAGTCLEIPCGPLGPDGGILDVDLGQKCDAIGTGDGTCLPNDIVEAADALYDGGGTTMAVANGIPSACWLGGTSSSACTLTAPPATPSERCPPGDGCSPLAIDGTSSNGVCVPACDPAGAPSCPAGAQCVGAPILDPAGSVGFCYAGGSGGCLSGLPASQTELFLCKSDGDCGCPQSCVQTPSGGAKWCSRSCTTTGDCPNPSTGCSGGFCGYLSCGPQPLGACTYVGTGDGTCLATGFSWAAASPFCVAAGSHTQGSQCSLTSPQSVKLVVSTYLPTDGVTFLAPAPSAFCAPGLLCVDNGSGSGTGTCQPSCNDQIPSGMCSSGSCYILDPSGFGFCKGGG